MLKQVVSDEWGGDFYSEWTGMNVERMILLMGIVAGVNIIVITAAREFLTNAWKIKSIPVPMNRNRMVAPWDHSYEVPSVQ